MGFEKLAKEIAQRCGISERKVREDFVRSIAEKVKELEDRGVIIGRRYSDGDDWLLVASSFDSVFKTITCILDHNTDYKDYERVPLEVGIGVAQYDKWAKLHGGKLIVETPTIEFLKTRIIDYYREWYKRTHSRSTESTFVVLTESAYNELEPLDRDICRKVVSEELSNKIKNPIMPFFVARLDKIVERGTVLNFLEKIKRPASSWYRRIDTIFVPPDEYQSIIECLEKHKAVFLVGDPEIGKTYTAVRIMWEYFSKGYNPVWYFGSELDERRNIRQVLSEDVIPHNSIIYFEDPFGKTRFEDREELRRRIGSVIEKIQSSNAKVIITSREEVFKEFNKEKLSQSDLRALTVEMRLMKPSYTEEKMEEILNKWAAEFGCKWMQNEDLKRSVISSAQGKLATPLSLRDFALASKDCDDANTIGLMIEQKSKEVKQAFAEEIAKMSKEKIMFLTVTYVLHLLKPEKIRAIYCMECEKFGLDTEANPFDYLKDRFMSRITYDQRNTGFEFTHPSYEEGLVLSWNRIEVETYFLKIMNDLVKHPDPFVRGLCGFCLTKNFGAVSYTDEAKGLIDTVLHDRSADARNGVAEATRYYFKYIPFSLALENLRTMANDRNRAIRACAIRISADNFKRIPMQESLRLIYRGLEDRAAWVRLETVGSVRGHMENFPEEIINKALACCEKLRDYTGWLIRYFASLDYDAFKEEALELKHKRDSSK